MKTTKKMIETMAGFLDLQKKMNEALSRQPKSAKGAEDMVLEATSFMGKTINQVEAIIALSESMTDKEFKDLHKRGLPIKSRKAFISTAKLYVKELSKELALVKYKIEELKAAKART